MIFTGKSAAKLASLSAAGVGMLTFGAKNAAAGIIDSGIINQKVGFDAGFGASFTSPTLGTGAANFKFSFVQSHPNIDTHRKVLFGGNSIAFKACTSSCGHSLRVFGAGATWSSLAAGPSRANGIVASLIGANLTAFPSLSGQRAFTDQFALMRFASGASTLYGWMELTLVDNDRPGPPTYGPDLTIVRYVYDDSGGKLAAGSLTPASPSVPEPGTLEVTGLAALALGAKGLRRWRKAQKTTAQA
ncbi:conserved exported hypothetical protein [Candidatus Sulfopaludibacter sp. SbA3]|nr:conserved exported hypothetical protein [Candidatus Sulfopaludibacter sp. SbA3]